MTADFLEVFLSVLLIFVKFKSFYSTLIKNWWTFKRSVISKMSDINRLTLRLSLFCPRMHREINDGKCFLILFAKTLEISFASILIREI